MLERFSEWSPTPFDSPRRRILDGNQWIDVSDWLICTAMQTRDSDDLANSNFEAVKAALAETGPEASWADAEPGDWYECSFGHWGPGWLSILIVRPGSTAAAVAAELAAHLADYPVLDEDDYSRREWETVCDTWLHMSLQDRMDLCAKHAISIFAARREEIPQGLPYLDDLLGN